MSSVVGSRSGDAGPPVAASRSQLAALVLLLSAACATTSAADLPATRVSLVLQTTQRKTLSIAELRGRVVLLNIISTWADPALVEVPRFKAMRAKYAKEDLEIVTVTLDTIEMAQIFKKTFEIPYQVAISENPADMTSIDGPLGGVALLPTSFLLDREGHIAARMEGMWPEEVLEEALDRLVARDQRGP